MIVCAFYTNRTTSALRFIMLRKLSPSALKVDMKIAGIIKWACTDLALTRNIISIKLRLGIDDGLFS